MSRSVYFLILMGCFALVPGCSNQPSFENHVSGQITLDGEPVVEGTISFIPQNGKTTVTGPIKTGLFGLDAKPGAYKVEIELPGRAKEIRDVDVPSKGPKKIDFELKSS